MRSASMAAKSRAGSSPSWPVAVSESTTGESGGMYQTIGIVRYSGCSGSAIRYVLISARTGERRAAVIQSCGMPESSAARATSGSSGSRKQPSWAS